MWVEFVVQVLVLAPRRFSPGTPVFPSTSETIISKSGSCRLLKLCAYYIDTEIK